MVYRFAKLFFLAAFAVVFSPEGASACKNAGASACAPETAKQPAAAAGKCASETCACCTSAAPETQGCPSENGGDCGQKCPCGPTTSTSSGHAGGILAENFPGVLLNPIFDARHAKQAFYFEKHLPEEVFLPIWEPPQLNV